MSDAFLYHKQKLCYTDVSDFTDFQGVGSDLLYKRFDSVMSVLKSCVDEAYLSFIAQPVYQADDDRVEWYVDKWNDTPVRYNALSGTEKERYRTILETTIKHYRNAASKLENTDDLRILGGVLYDMNDEKIFCYDGKVVIIAWGMKPDPYKTTDIGSLIYTSAKAVDTCQVTFDVAGCGTIPSGMSKFKVKKGSSLEASMIPTIIVNEGYHVLGWSPNPLGMVINEDTVFVAQREIETVAQPSNEDPTNQFFNVNFDAGEHGTLEGAATCSVLAGSVLAASMIPTVTAKKGYKFKGWDIDPLKCAVDKDMTIKARYRRSVWSWLRWVLWGLLGLLITLLLILLLRSCMGCGGNHVAVPVPGLEEEPWVGTDPRVGDGGGIYDPGNPYTPIPTPPEYSDVLPPTQGVLPPITDDDPIVSKPGEPRVLANKLNVLMENTDKSIMDLAKAFKQKYPSDEYKVVYYDDVIKRMQIEVPVAKREALKDEIPAAFAPEYDLFVFEEFMYETRWTPSDPEFSSNSKTWYFNTINAFSAWNISTGSENVTVAIVDNGFNLGHKEFKGKVVMPYNVWNHNSQVVKDSRVDHGSHVAAIAIGLADNGSGLCGIAPKCKFMPIQVADENGAMTTTSVVDGVVYAIYQGAKVVNVSLGDSFEGLDRLPESTQRELIYNHFKNEERLWNEISRIADSHNVTIVVAAGNDNVLAGIEAMHRPENIIVVSALDKQNRHFRKTNFSNYGEYSTISAPGVDIYSAYGNGYRSMDGTSMSAPIVTGAVALMKSMNKNLTNEQIKCVLTSTAKNVDDKVGPLLQLDKALMKVKNNEIDDCSSPDGEISEPTHGDVEITLHWNNKNDLDIACIDPNGEQIYFSHPQSRSGGQLEIDRNRNAANLTTNPLEHIYWPTSGAPSGTYQVFLTHYRKFDNVDDSPYTIDVKYGNQTKQFTGTISHANGTIPICTFSLNADGSGNSSVDPGHDTSNGNSDVSRRRRELIDRRNQLQRELDEINNSLRNLQ